LALEGAEPISAEAVDKGPKEEQATQVCHLLQLSSTVMRPNLATFVALFLSAVKQSPCDSTSLHTRLADTRFEQLQGLHGLILIKEILSQLQDSLMIMCLLTCRVPAGAPK